MTIGSCYIFVSGLRNDSYEDKPSGYVGPALLGKSTGGISNAEIYRCITALLTRIPKVTSREVSRTPSQYVVRADYPSWLDAEI